MASTDLILLIHPIQVVTLLQEYICVYNLCPGQATVGRMYDVLLGAKQTAEHLIQETLNGHNFGRQFVVQKESLKKLRSMRNNLETVRKEVTEVCNPLPVSMTHSSFLTCVHTHASYLYQKG